MLEAWRFFSETVHDPAVKGNKNQADECKSLQMYQISVNV